MPVVHGDSRRKSTGGRKYPNSKRKKREIGGEFSETELGDHEVKHKDARGSGEKVALQQTSTVSVSQDDGTTTQADIEAVVENPANPDYVRRDIITKGTIVRTSEGRVRITSRPGQNGSLSGVAVEDE